MNDHTMAVTGASGIEDILTGSFDLTNSALNTGVYTVPNPQYYGNISITTTNGTGTIPGSLISNPSLKVTGPAEFDQDITIKGVSILKNLEAINDRLAILQPNPEKLEKFAALKKAYEYYKTLEALCDLEEKKEK